MVQFGPVGMRLVRIGPIVSRFFAIGFCYDRFIHEEKMAGSVFSVLLKRSGRVWLVCV